VEVEEVGVDQGVVLVEQVVLELSKNSAAPWCFSFSKCNFFTSFNNSLSNYSRRWWCWCSGLLQSATGTGSNSIFSTITSAGGGGGGSEMELVLYQDGNQVDQVEEDHNTGNLEEQEIHHQ
jgi:hypothetical protein